MNKLSDLLKTLGLDRNVTAVRGLGSGFTVLTLDDGVELGFKSAKPKRVRKVAAPVRVPMQDVAYFTYPSSDGGMRLSRRVIVFDDGNERQSLLRGYETSNDADYQFKAFKVSRMFALRIVSEPISDADVAFFATL